MSAGNEKLCEMEFDNQCAEFHYWRVFDPELLVQ